MDDEDTFYPSDQELFGSDDTSLLSTDLSSYSEDSGLSTLDIEDHELKLINKMKKVLTGIPPPPSITIPMQDFNEVLRSWNASLASQSNVVEPESKSQNTREEISKNILNAVLDTNWPEIKDFQFYDINYNKSKFSEKLAALYDKYVERFVGYETSSFMTINSPTKSILKKSPKRNNLSVRKTRYLTERKKTFSLESLQSLNKSSSINNWKNRLIIDTAKNSNKTDDSKIQECTNRFACNKGRSSRRALFGISKNGPVKADDSMMYPTNFLTPKKKKMSPLKKRTPKKKEERTPRKRTIAQCYSLSSISSGCSRDNENQNRHFPIDEFSPVKNRDNDGQFTSASIITQLRAESASKKKRMENYDDLTYSQKVKLLWAVSSALKTEGIGGNHEQFKLYGQKLFKVCKRAWLLNCNQANIKVGISERMNTLACKHVKDVVEAVSSNNISADDLISQDSSSCDSFFRDKKDSFIPV